MTKPAPPLTFAVLRAPDTAPPEPAPTALGFGGGDEDAAFCSFALGLLTCGLCGGVSDDYMNARAQRTAKRVAREAYDFSKYR